MGNQIVAYVIIATKRLSIFSSTNIMLGPFWTLVLLLVPGPGRVPAAQTRYCIESTSCVVFCGSVSSTEQREEPTWIPLAPRHPQDSSRCEPSSVLVPCHSLSRRINVQEQEPCNTTPTLLRSKAKAQARRESSIEQLGEGRRRPRRGRSGPESSRQWVRKRPCPPPWQQRRRPRAPRRTCC